MVIGFDGSRAFVKGRTGTENYSYQLLKALSQIDEKNQYIVYIRPSSVIARSKATKQSSSEYNPTKIASLIARNDEKEWPQNFRFKVINWPKLWTQGGLALETFKDDLDVLFVPAHTLPILRRPGLKTVVTVHDLGSEYLPSMHQIKQRLYLDFMQKYQLKTATKLIAVSKATKKDLIKRAGIKEDKITVIYEGFDKTSLSLRDKNLFKPTKGDALVNGLRQYGLELGKYFLFVGTVQPRKNLERLIKAFNVIARSAPPRSGKYSWGETTKQSSSDNNPTKIASLIVRNDDLKLVIVGQKGWLSDKIYQLPRQLGIEDRVRFLGYVPEEELPVLYSGATAFVFPSLFEGFGLPVLEAQACGCPVLTSGVSSLPEVAGKGAVYVDPYDVNDIVKGMRKFAGAIHESPVQRMVKSGFENISRFSWEKCARETLKVLEG